MKRMILVVWLMFLLPIAWAGASGAWFGVQLGVEANGAADDPLITSVTVKGIAPGSPADHKDIQKGDQVLAVDGHLLAGSKPTDVALLIHGKQPGDKVDMKLKRADGSLHEVVLVAIAKPANVP